MLSKWFVTFVALLGCAQLAAAQARRDTATLAADGATSDSGGASSSSGGVQWKRPNRGTAAGGDSAADNAPAPLRTAAAESFRAPIARATKLDGGALPSDAGQELWKYDISPYTARVTSTNRPEQAVRDWILRETGYEAWHGEPFSALSADRNALTVYATPQLQSVVRDMVDRFVNTEAESYAFSMRVVTVPSPDWRVKAHRLLRPLSVQSPGVQAWLMHREDSALMLTELLKRYGVQEHSTPHLMVNNGQSAIVAKTRSRNYIKDVVLRANQFPGYEPQTAQLDEGFKLEFHPLLSLDGKVIDAILKCEIDQVEKLVPVDIDVSTSVSRQQQRIEVPQAIAARLHERFHWPADQVLLISLGVVPTPVPPAPGAFGLKVPLLTPGSRADLLVFIKSEGKVNGQPSALQPAGRTANQFQNRYYRGATVE
jgi:hypothetical protein